MATLTSSALLAMLTCSLFACADEELGTREEGGCDPGAIPGEQGCPSGTSCVLDGVGNSYCAPNESEPLPIGGGRPPAGGAMADGGSGDAESADFAGGAGGAGGEGGGAGEAGGAGVGGEGGEAAAGGQGGAGGDGGAGGMGGVGGMGGMGGVPDACGEFRINLKPSMGSIPRVMLVVDRSYSMINSEDRWTPVLEGLSAVTRALEENIEFGLVLFPGPTAVAPDEQLLNVCINGGRRNSFCDNPVCARDLCIDDSRACTPGQEVVPVALRQGGAIRNALTNFGPAPNQGTPTASALRVAGEALLAGPPGERIILLATDGAPGCNFNINPLTCDCLTSVPFFCSEDRFASMCLDDRAVVGEIERLQGLGIDTLVLGITRGLPVEGACLPNGSCPAGGQRCEGGRCVNLMPRVLEDMAAAGGRAPDGQPLQVNELAALEGALAAAAGSLAPCRYDISRIPEELWPLLEVLIDGMSVAEDPAEMNGWSIRDGQLELFGAACEALRDGQPHVLSARCSEAP